MAVSFVVKQGGENKQGQRKLQPKPTRTFPALRTDMAKPGRKPGANGAAKQPAKATRQAPNEVPKTTAARKGAAPTWATKKKALQQRLTACSDLAEVQSAFESVLGTDWVTDVSGWSASQLESVTAMLEEHVDVPEVLAAADPNGALVGALARAADMADSEEDSPPRQPAKKKTQGLGKEGKVGKKKGGKTDQLEAQLLDMAARIRAEKERREVDEEEEENSEEDDFMAKLRAALAGEDGVAGKPKKSKGVALPARAQSVGWRVLERMLPEVLEEVNDNGGGFKAYVMTTRQGQWRNQESRKVVMNIALAMDLALKELGPAAGEMVFMEVLMRVVAALLLVENQGSGGWRVASQVLALKEEASLVTNRAMKMALHSATLLEKLAKGGQQGK